MKRLFCLAAIAAALMGQSFTAQAAGVEFAVGQTSDSTMTYRLGMKFDWDKSWLQSDVGRLTGYWSGAYTYWEGDKTSSNNSLSFSPVFVYEFAGQIGQTLCRGGDWRRGVLQYQVRRQQASAGLSSSKTASVLACASTADMKSGFVRRTIPTPVSASNNDGVESYSLHYTMPL